MNKCNGTNCEAVNGEGHSEECLKEYWDSVNGVNKIKAGDLVKAWNDNVVDYTVGVFEDCAYGLYYLKDDNGYFLENNFDHATKIPDELSRQLKELK